MNICERDVVVIGGGHSGRSCAAHPAKVGFDVLVLQRQGVPGGPSATEKSLRG